MASCDKRDANPTEQGAHRCALLHALWTDNRRRPIVVGLLKAKNSARTTYILHWLRQRYT